jgi:hypothetical protein
MDDELHELEAELKRLQPCGLPARLVAGVAAELSDETPKPRNRSSRSSMWWLGVPVAAAVAVFAPNLVRLSPPGDTPTMAGSLSTRAGQVALKPVAAQNLLLSASNEGVVTLDDGTPARRERLEFVDTITWKNPETNASLTWRVPREEVRFIPVVFH